MKIDRSNALQANFIASILYWVISLGAFSFELYEDVILGEMHKYGLTTAVLILINPVMLAFYAMNSANLLPSKEDDNRRNPISIWRIFFGYTPLPFAIFLTSLFTYEVLTRS